MKRLSLILLSAMLCVLAACEYDDTELREQLAEQEERLVRLEKLCSEMNGNLSGLRSIVHSLQNNVAIRSVEPILEQEKVIGYGITFTQGETIKIYNGQDGRTPQIGVKAAEDGSFYWTLDNAWLLDEHGRKVRADAHDGVPGADGADGADGLTPELKIEEGYWWLKLGTAEWQRLGEATGAAGEDAGNFFQNVQVKDTAVDFQLMNGETITLPLKGGKMGIVYNRSNIRFYPKDTAHVVYRLSGTGSKAVVKAFGKNGWRAKTIRETDTTGRIVIYAPEQVKDDEITVIVHDGEEHSIMSSFKVFDSLLEMSVNGVKVPMIWVKGGTFTMGATPEQGSDAQTDEKPAHQVTLSDYYIGQFEVTQKLWEAVMGSNPSYFKGNPQYPVEQVSWEDIVNDFLPKLNALTGRNFVLPTEAQWEYAARGGSKSQGYKYSGSNNIGEVAWYIDNSDFQTHPVGEKHPNELGIYDMSGNVWEWCRDWYGDYTSLSQTDPTGPDSGSSRVLRGDSSWGFARPCRVSGRGGSTPGHRIYDLGFRLALSL